MNVKRRVRSKKKKEDKEVVAGSGEEIEAVVDALNEDEEDELLREVVDGMNADFGADTAFIPETEDVKLCNADKWVSLTDEVNEIIGTPGAPAGYITHIYGPPDSGKTTLACHALADTQAQGGIAILGMTERKFSLQRAARIGVNIKKLIIIKAKTMEDFFAKMEKVLKKIKAKSGGRLVTIVWDSLGGTVTKAELEGDADDMHMAVAARVIKKNLRRLVQYLADENICFIIINQIYGNIGVMFGKKTKPYGGNAPYYHSALGISITQVGKLTESAGGKKVKTGGIKSLVAIEKNHLGRPFGEVEIKIDADGVI